MLALALDEICPEQAPWTTTGALAGGSQGAVRVRDRAGRRFVVKRHPGAPRAPFDEVGSRVERVRARGVPAPAMQVHEDDAGVLLLLEHLDGTAGLTPSPEVAEELLALNALHEGVTDDSAAAWSGLMEQSLVEGLEGYCEHGSMEQFSDESRDILSRVRAVGRAADWSVVQAGDLVHYDFHPGNVLVTEGHVTGIVDWDGCRSGDRLVDVAGLAFTCSYVAGPDTVDRLWTELLSLGDEQRRQIAVHHIVLRLADWCIRHSARAHAERVVAYGTTALDRLSRS